MKIEVTAELISESRRLIKERPGYRCSQCPVAAAMTKALGQPVQTNGRSWAFDELGPWFSLPEGVQFRIKRFDALDQMEPFSFEVSDEDISYARGHS
jgi:hypothetical protein